MKQLTTHIAVALFLISGIVLIGGLFIFEGRLGEFFTPLHITIDFPASSELIQGSGVYLSGAVIGKIISNPRAVSATHEEEVDVQIQADVPLRTGDVFEVTGEGLLGDRFINVRPIVYASSVPESEKAPFIENGDHMNGMLAKNISKQAVEEVKTALSKVHEQILAGATPDDIKATLENLNISIQKPDQTIQEPLRK